MRRKLRDQCLGREKPVERRVWYQRDRTEATPPNIFNWNNFRFWEGVEFCVLGQGDTGFFLLLTCCSCSLWVRLLHILSLRPYLAPPIPASTRQMPMLLKQANGNHFWPPWKRLGGSRAWKAACRYVLWVKWASLPTLYSHLTLPPQSRPPTVFITPLPPHLE